MTIDVELGALFCGTVFANCAYHWPATIVALAVLTAEQANTVIDVIEPEYLTILAEPTTEAQLTKIAAFTTPTGAEAYVHNTLAAIRNRKSTKIGAGAGTWLPTSFAKAILREPIDYLDTHLYPVGPNIATTLAETAQLAHDARKPLVIDELWLYKTDASTTANGVALAEGENELNRFSFWIPLDVRFLYAVEKWSASAGVVYESAFQSSNFFFYLHWPTLDAASFASASAMYNRHTIAAMQAGITTLTGDTWAHP